VVMRPNDDPELARAEAPAAADVDVDVDVVIGAPAPASGRRPDSDPAVESDGWFTVARAAELLELAIPRVFDRIRDGKLQVRFVPTRPGEPDRPLVTSHELKLKAAGPTSPPPPPPPASSAARDVRDERDTRGQAERDDLRRTVARLQSEAKELREIADAVESRLDTALKTIYERDVRIARLEAESGANVRLREEGEQFVRHLEGRLDRQDQRNEEKEKEIRRLAVGLGEAHGEIRLLRPPAPEPPKAWKKFVVRFAVFLTAAGGAGLCFWFSWQLAQKSLAREAGLAAGAGALLAFAIGYFLDRLRRAK